MFQRLKSIGPGAMVAAAFIGPGTITTATLAGSGYGYTLLWAVLFSTIACIILQEMAARLGVVGKMGIGTAIRKKVKSGWLKLLLSILVIGAILVGNAAYEAGNIIGAAWGFESFEKQLGLSFNPVIFVIGAIAFFLLYTGRYKLIEKFLVALVAIMGIVFLITAISVKPDLGAIVKGFFIPSLPENGLLLIVGLIGTTVVPYNLFLHASSVNKKWTSKENLSEARFDTILSVALGGVITAAILIAAAAAFEGNNQPINSAKDLSVQLQPILGEWSKNFIAFGFLAAGLSSSITAPLAAAFATSEIMNWEESMQGKRFRIIWIFVLLVGLIFASLGFKPTSVILFSQVANGLLLPIISILLLWIMNDKAILGNHVNSLKINILGVAIILITIGLGLKGILSAFKFI